MKNKIELTQSHEKYLSAIYSIVKEQKAARVKDISNFLSIGASSVSEALKNLVEKELINYQNYGIITLTTKGEKIAVKLEKRHQTICDFLKNVLMVDENIIEENARKIEYGVSKDVLEKFTRFLYFMQTCSCKEPKWIKSFKYYAQNGKVQEKCNSCIKKCSEGAGKDNSNCCGMG